MYKMSQDERERYLYLREEMAYSDEISRMKTAREEGLEEGRKEGRKEGKQLFLQCIRLKKQGFSRFCNFLSVYIGYWPLSLYSSTILFAIPCIISFTTLLTII